MGEIPIPVQVTGRPERTLKAIRQRSYNCAEDRIRKIADNILLTDDQLARLARILLDGSRENR